MDEREKQLEEKRQRLNQDLISLAFSIADDGRKLYEIKEDLRITNILLEKWKSQNISTASVKQ